VEQSGNRLANKGKKVEQKWNKSGTKWNMWNKVEQVEHVPLYVPQNLVIYQICSTVPHLCNLI